MSHKTRLLAILTALLAVSLLSLAGAAMGGEDAFHVRGHRATYRNPSTSPRARGMGGTYAALSNGASGVYENPAALGAQTDRATLFDLGLDWIEKDGQEATWVTINAGGAFNINICAPEYWPRENVGNHTLGFVVRHNGVIFEGSDGLETDVDGFILGYGRSFFGGRFFGGFAAAYDEGDQADDDRRIDTDLNLWEFRLGGIYRASPRLALGMVAVFARGSMDGTGTLYDYDGQMSNVEVRSGASYRLDSDTLIAMDVLHYTLETDYDGPLEEHSVWRLSAGVERVLQPETLTARAGAYYQTDSYHGRNAPSSSLVDDYGGLTLGVSYFQGLFELGYGMDIRTTGEVGHLFRLEYDW